MQMKQRSSAWLIDVCPIHTIFSHNPSVSSMPTRPCVFGHMSTYQTGLWTRAVNPELNPELRWYLTTASVKFQGFTTTTPAHRHRQNILSRMGLGLDKSAVLSFALEAALWGTMVYLCAGSMCINAFDIQVFLS
jgi:hypothetical protein